MPRARALAAMLRSKVTSVASNRLANRNVDRIRSTKVDIKTPQNPICCVDIGGRDLLPVCRSSDPCIEVGECKLPVFPREVVRPHTPPDGRGELGDAEITDDDNLQVCRQKGLGASARRVDGKQCDENARVKIKAHFSPSSRISLTSVPASVLGMVLPTRLARSHSISASAIGRGTGRTGFSSTP